MELSATNQQVEAKVKFKTHTKKDTPAVEFGALKKRNSKTHLISKNTKFQIFQIQT